MFNVSRQYREETSQKISWGHWFTFFNIIWAIVIGSRYAFLIDWPDTLFGKLYFFVSLLGHFSFIVFAFYLLVIFPLSFAIKNTRTFRGISVIISTLCVTLLLVDTEVFARFNLHLSSLVWNLLVNPDKGELSRDWQLFFVPMPLILLVQMLFSRWSWHKLRSLNRQKWAKKVALLFTCFFIATHLIYAWADAYIYRPITMQKSNFPLSYPMTARSFLEKHGFLDKEKYATKLDQQGRPEAPQLEYPKNHLQFNHIDHKPNIILITLSGLRYDVINQTNTPNLSAFAAKSSSFEQHYSTGNEEQAGIVGLFYGLSANYGDSILNGQISSPLLDKLSAEHYQFTLFSAQKFKQPLFKQALFKSFKLANQSASNVETVNHFLQALNNAPMQGWFSYLDLDLSQKMESYHATSLAQEQQHYLHLLKEIDDSLGQVLQQLEQKMNNSIVIITAEQGYAFKFKQLEQDNAFSAASIKVPFIIHGINLEKPNKITSHVDLLPTLMEHIFLVKNPAQDYAQGQNLFKDNMPDWVLAGNNRWNVIIDSNGTQYQIDKYGNYRKYNAQDELQSPLRPPLGLFLEAFNKERSFIEN